MDDVQVQEGSMVKAREVVSTGDGELDKKMGGGVPLGSLTLVEGQSDSGKSVVLQHFTSGALRTGFGVAYYTSEDTVKSLVRQMGSLGMEILDYFLADRLRIYPLAFSSETKDPDLLASNLVEHIASLPESLGIIMIDSVTNLVVHSDEARIIDFFSTVKVLCERGRTVFLVVHSSAFSENMLIRVRSLCDAHFRLHLEQAGERLVKVLEVSKVRNADRNTGNVISFDVEPGLGMHIIPISKAKA